MNTHTFRRRSYRNINCSGAYFDFIPVFKERVLELEAETGSFAGEINCRYRVSRHLEGMSLLVFVQRSSKGSPVGDMVLCAPGDKNSGEFSIPGLEPGKEYFVIGVANDNESGYPGEIRELVSDIAVAGSLHKFSK